MPTASFCSSCGSKIANPGKSRFCNACGASLGAPAPREAEAPQPGLALNDAPSAATDPPPVLTKPRPGPATVAMSNAEVSVARDRFRPNPFAFWLTVDLATTERRLQGRWPETFMGLIPMGSKDLLIPLKQIAGLSVNTRLHPLRLFFGAVFVLLGIALLFMGGAAALIGIVVLVLGVALVGTGLTASLDVTNTGGMTQSVEVSMFEKAKLQTLASKSQTYLVDA